MKVKICGIRNIEDALVAEQSGADFIGFVFAPSKRRISVEDAVEIASLLSSHTKIVGVFVNESIETMTQIAKKVGLDYIQLHGDETADTAKAISYPVIKACPVNKLTPEIIHDYPADYLLIDSPGEKYRGGSGKTFDWKLLDQVGFKNNKFILAGGLTPENIAEAIEATNPFAVDVSSGVETDGKKDHDKIRRFLQQAKKAGKVETDK
jgi:phosphoribosylanthranilate isomerase